MRLTRAGYYADFVVYPALLLAVGWESFTYTLRRQRWDWRFAFLLGFLAWTLLEYVLHRFVLHQVQPFKRLHELHHARQTDLVGTPSWFSVCAFGAVAFTLWRKIDFDLASGLMAVLMLGYLWYVAAHHAVHYRRANPGSWLYRAKVRHALHHHALHPCNFA